MIPSKNESEQQYSIKFFIELTECFCNESKIKPFKEYKDEFSKIKQKKLLNAIKFAEKFYLGEMTFKQHAKFIKEGLKLFEEQCSKLEEIKKEKEALNNITNKSNEITLNSHNISNKLPNDPKTQNEEIKKDKNSLIKYKQSRHFLGIKRNLPRKDSTETNTNSNPNNNNCSNSIKNHISLDLIYSIDDFIFNKRDYKLNDYDDFFKTMEEKIKLNKLNTNSFHVSKNLFLIFIIIIKKIIGNFKIL